MSGGLGSYSHLAEALAKARTRSSWNDRLAHWERPASEHEETKIQRAATMARSVVLSNTWLSNEGVVVEPQGSYHNNTNVRLEADMDLRALHPAIYIEYRGGAAPDQAYREFGYFDLGRTFAAIASDMRRHLAADLVNRFGAVNVKVGNKAIKVAGLSGSRADVDVVPAFKLHWITPSGGTLGGHIRTDGVAILGADNAWTINFPEQHHANGKSKRARTKHRFKKVVRMLKRLNYELAETKLLNAKLPSFLVECLVYQLEDEFFLIDEDRYDRLKRILGRLSVLIENTTWHVMATEINGIKPLLFGQPWTLTQIREFVYVALMRLDS